jgi:ABC-type multidrug transport system fused ATPase/permease subunit
MYTKLSAILTGQEKRKFAVLLAAILLMAVLEVVGIAAILPFMKLVSAPETLEQNRWLSEIYERLEFDSFRSFLLFAGSIVLGLMTLSRVTVVLVKWLQHHVVWISAHSLSTRLLATYLRQPYAFFLEHEPSKLQKQVIGEIKQLVREVLLPLVRLAAHGIVSIIVFVLLIIVDPAIALMALGILGGSYVLIYLVVRRYLFKLGVKRFQLFRMSFKTVAEIFGVTKSIKVHRCERHFIRQFRVIDREQSKLQPKYAVVGEAPKNLVELLSFGAILGILLYLVAKDQSMQEIIPMLSLYALAGHRLVPSLQETFKAMAMLRFNHSVLDSIHRDLTSAVRSPAEVVVFPRNSLLSFNRSIELRSVSFSYAGYDEVVLKDIDLTIDRGSRIAFVGPTGSGKSTLADVILGLLQPSSGEVLIDGIPLSRENMNAWLGTVGYIPQDVVLIDNSIRRNIAFGLADEQIDDGRVRHVADVARILEFIETELPDGFDTHVGERGIRLSGGQRQRIGLARALYHDPKVLIMDEATSSLDGITEESVMEALFRLNDQITVIMIAHRIVTVMGCDKIYLLEGGRIVDAGRYGELLETSTVFRGLARVAL